MVNTVKICGKYGKYEKGPLGISIMPKTSDINLNGTSVRPTGTTHIASGHILKYSIYISINFHTFTISFNSNLVLGTRLVQLWERETRLIHLHFRNSFPYSRAFVLRMDVYFRFKQQFTKFIKSNREQQIIYC